MMVPPYSASTVGTLGIWFIPFLIASLSYSNFNRNEPERRPIDMKKLHKHYDFIVVGAGSAGAVVANRLSENPAWRVLLLEAGGDESELSDIPVMAAYLQMGNMDWKYKTLPQPGRACLGHVNQQCNWPRGKVLGGSSVLNYMLYVRGNKRDYDNWEAAGNPGWGYEEVLKYFKKSEDNRNPYLAANNRYHATGGYLTVQESPWRTPLVTAFLEAGEEMGYPNRDGNGEFQTGFMIAQSTIRRGSRCSTSKAFLRPIRKRKNLHIAMHSHVLKLMIDPETKLCYGVKFRRYGKVWTVRSNREVILSAGALNSPQIMMLSGIGPSQHLQELGIPVVADLPVGENLQDHYGTGAMVFTIDKPLSLDIGLSEDIPSVLKYIMFGTGPLTVPGGVEGLAWVPTKYVNKTDDWPDIEFHFISGSVAADGGRQMRKTFGISDNMWNFFRPLAYKDSWSVIPMLLRPKSKGYVRVRSSNPFDSPILEAGYFKDPEDIKTLVEGVKIALAMANTESLQRYGSKFWDAMPMPGCENLIPESDEHLACLCRHFTATIYHHSGTAKMGRPTDTTAVVNHQLKVYGVVGLRVIDASIMPNVVSGNTNAPVIMIGEKGSDMIKEDWTLHLEDANRRKKREDYDPRHSWPQKLIPDPRKSWPEKLNNLTS